MSLEMIGQFNGKKKPQAYFYNKKFNFMFNDYKEQH